MYSGGFYPYDTEEEKWAFWARNIFANRYAPIPKDTYKNLLKLVEDKDYFVITTNVDHCFQRAGFDKKRLFYTQGDYGLFQCSKPCKQITYDNEEIVKEMLEQQKDFKIPSQLVPHCPNCGAPMEMNLRADNKFVEDEGWHEAAERYSEFVRRHQNLKNLYLEIGVGFNTPGIIKYNFWQQTAKNYNATYACLNFDNIAVPEQILKQSILIKGDCDEIIREIIEK